MKKYLILVLVICLFLQSKHGMAMNDTNFINKAPLHIFFSDPNFIKNNTQKLLQTGDTVSEGPILKSETELPFNYCIYYNTSKPIKAVLFQIYGGGRPNEYTSDINSYTRLLANEGIVVVVLDMVDIQARETGEFVDFEQSHYPLKLLNMLLKSLSFARHQMPEILQQVTRQELSSQLKYFLTGTSFGGHLTLLVATHPDSNINSLFDGYISQAASTDGNHTETSFPTIESFKRKLNEPLTEESNEHLNVIIGANNLQRPLLIMHGLNDFNVPAIGSIILLEDFIKLGKMPKLVNYYFFAGKEHGQPKSPNENLQYIEAMNSFIDTVIFSKPVASVYEGSTQTRDLLIHRYHKQALGQLVGVDEIDILKEKLVLHAIDIYGKSPHDDIHSKEVWLEKYVPNLIKILLQNFTVVNYKRFISLQTANLSDTADEVTPFFLRLKLHDYWECGAKCILSTLTENISESTIFINRQRVRFYEDQCSWKWFGRIISLNFPQLVKVDTCPSMYNKTISKKHHNLLKYSFSDFMVDWFATFLDQFIPLETESDQLVANISQAMLKLDFNFVMDSLTNNIIHYFINENHKYEYIAKILDEVYSNFLQEQEIYEHQLKQVYQHNRTFQGAINKFKGLGKKESK